MDKKLLQKVQEVYPLMVQQYEQYLPDTENPTAAEKINSMITALHHMGRLTNHTVKQWNDVMKWIVDNGLEETTFEYVHTEIDAMKTDGRFTEQITTAVNQMHTHIQDTLNDFSSDVTQTKNEVFRKRQMEDLADDVIAAMTEGATVNVLSIPQDGSVDEEKTTFLSIGDNKFNRNDPRNKEGFLLGTNGKETALANWGYTHPISTKIGDTWTIDYGASQAYTLYDKNGNFLALKGAAAGTVEKPFTFTIDVENTDYMIVNLQTTDFSSSRKMIVKGLEYPSYFIPYVVNQSEAIGINVTQSKEVKKIVNNATITDENIKSIVDIENSINRFNKADFDYGYTSTSNVFYDLNTYFTTHKIPVKNGDVVRYSYASTMGVNNVLFVFDENDEKIYHELGQLDTNSKFRTVQISNEKASYVKAQDAIGKLGSFMVTVNEEFPVNYLPFYKNYTFNENFLLNKKQKNQTSQNILFGKIMSNNGDSIAKGLESDDTVSSYAKIIAERNNMVSENIAVGGGTLTAETYTDTGSPRHWICRTIANMRTDADYYILEGGVNDASLGVPIGTITNGFNAVLDDTTFCGALESICKQAHERFAGKKIGFVVTHKMTLEKQEEYYPHMYEILEKWGINYVDLYKTIAPMRYIENIKTTYTRSADGWHPNKLGYELFYCDPIEAFMKKL